MNRKKIVTTAVLLKSEKLEYILYFWRQLVAECHFVTYWLLQYIVIINSGNGLLWYSQKMEWYSVNFVYF